MTSIIFLNGGQPHLLIKWKKGGLQTGEVGDAKNIEQFLVLEPWKNIGPSEACPLTELSVHYHRHFSPSHNGSKEPHRQFKIKVPSPRPTLLVPQ